MTASPGDTRIALVWIGVGALAGLLVAGLQSISGILGAARLTRQ